MAGLFSNSFIQAVSRLTIRVRQVPAQGRPADHRSRELGSGMEFCDFKSYAPGDDFRRIDWNLYRRSRRLFLRLFEELEHLPIHILLDMSDSMFFETPPRANAARRMAAVLAAIALNQQDEIGIWPVGVEDQPPSGIFSGKQALPRILSYLEALEPGGRIDLKEGIQRFARMPRRSGLAVVISDFFDPQGIESVLEGMRSLRHRLLLVQVIKAADLHPELHGEVRLVDCESGGTVDLLVDPKAMEGYQAAYRDFCEALLNFGSERKGALLRIDADRPVLDQLEGIFINNVFVI